LALLAGTGLSSPARKGKFIRPFKGTPQLEAVAWVLFNTHAHETSNPKG